MTRPRMKANNIDEALTSEPERDPWGDHDEMTEDVGEAGKLRWGRRVHGRFAALRAAADELLRQVPEVGAKTSVKRAGNEPVAEHCQKCGCDFVGWHACAGMPYTPIEEVNMLARQAGMPKESYDIYSAMTDYYERLGFLDKAKLRRIVPAEWRQPPGYPNYLMHSQTRELWRQSYDKTLPNGAIRRYPARMCSPRNGSYSLTVDGVTSTRGVNALWTETFPEYGTKKKPKHAGAIKPHRDELSYYPGLAEWLSDGGAGIVTRPK